MKSISKAMGLSLLAGMLLAGCTTETVQKGGGGDNPQPGGDGNEQRREVQFSLNNELVLHKATNQPTRADETIATVEENAITSLDVYVFGCATEQGDYTFQERFAYRADDQAALPAGATLMDLQAVAGTKNQTQGMLKLKKGLFVKLYCIANSPTLINPASKKAVDESEFIGLTFSDPGKTGTGVATEGTPSESEFLTLHTPLLEADQPTDILLTPLAMSGSYTTPIDLTDFESSTRMQLSVKLTRLAARFDVVNNAKDSRFTIKEIALGNGRRGATYFPIRIYGETPTANLDELITYPVRKFDGEKANIDKQTGAFYSYPSPLEDKGYLILKGIYQVNQTEEKEVAYQIPFTQYQDDGSATAIAINNNHRYTIGITKADDYHLDFTLEVADWTDSGKIDDYTPGGDDEATIEVKIPDVYTGETVYTEETHTVAMYIKDDASNFDLLVHSSAPLTFQHSYAGGLAAKEFDWLVIKDNSTPGLSEYKYNLSLVKGYDKKRYPKAVLRFMNLTDGTETVLFVDALAAPSLNETTQPNGSFNAFDPLTAKASLYKTTESKVQIQLTCPDGVTIKEQPSWLDVNDPEQSGTNYTYTFTLNDRETTDATGKIVFCNTKVQDWIVEVNVDLLDASTNPVFGNIDGTTGNTFTDASGATPANVDMSFTENNNFTIKITSLKGVSVSIDYAEGSSNWLLYGTGDGTKAATTQNDIKFSLKPIELAKGLAKKATVTLKNLSGGPDYTFTVTPKFVAPTLTLVSGTPTQNMWEDATNTLSLYKVNNSSVEIKASSFGGNKIIESKGVSVTGWVDTYKTDQTYTITWDNNTTENCSFTLVNKSDETAKKVVTVAILNTEVTPEFTSVSGNNTYDSATKNVTMSIVDGSSYKLTTSSPAGITVQRIEYEDGSINWLSSSLTKSASVSNVVIFSISKTAFSDGGKAKKATVTLKNGVAGGKDFVFTVKPEFQAPTLTTNPNITLAATKSTSQVPTATIEGTCLGGCSIEGEDWITYDKKTVNTDLYSYKLTLDPNTPNFPTSLPGTQTITLVNNQDETKTTQVSVSFAENNAWIASSPSGYSESTGDGYRVPTSGGTMTVSVYTMFATPTLNVSYDDTYCTSTNNGRNWLSSSSTSPTGLEISENRRKYTFKISVSAASGTDAAYQLHKGAVTLKHGSNNAQIAQYTVWRGASYYGYPVSISSGSGSPYYSAVKKKGYWWAPVNCGASKIPTNGSDLNGTGYLYQWGRKITTTSSSSYTYPGPVTSQTDTHEFISTSAAPNDWLKTKNDALWGYGGPKASNDPCPSGWRVPSRTQIDTWISGTEGKEIMTVSGENGINLVLPFAGLRGPEGEPRSQGENFFFWTNTPDGTIARHIFQSGGKMTTNNYSTRSFAMSVRCIKE